MSEKYLLPCSCGEQIAVERRQAGTLLTCKCGKSLEVPTIRELTKLQPASETVDEPQPPLWGRRQGLIFLGLVVAVPAFALAGYWYSYLPILNETNINEWASQLTPHDSWIWWRQYEQGIPKRPTIATAAVMKGMESLNLKINLSLLVGLVGVLLSASSLLVKSKQPEKSGRLATDREIKGSRT